MRPPSPVDNPGFPGSRGLQTDPQTASIAGLEREDFYITYEPVGHMLRNSRAITPRNNLLFDAFWSLAGTVSFGAQTPRVLCYSFGAQRRLTGLRLQIVFPIWRIISPDGEVRKAAKTSANS